MPEPQKSVVVPTTAVHVFRLRKPLQPDAQADTLIRAARDGVPFCEECEAARARERNAAA